MKQSSTLLFLFTCTRYAIGGVFPWDLEISDALWQDINVVYPGTNWCGAGNIAEDYDDLGWATEADKCCRAHDNCPDKFRSGDNKYNLKNDAFYTRLSCECDKEFRQCLHNADSIIADHIGKLYFDELGTKCFRKDYPTRGCKRRRGWFDRRCLIYKHDDTAPKVFQWFDVPEY